MKKVAIGLSGGVDSAVAAYLLVEAGYDVQAFYIEAYNEPGCRTDQDKKDALKVALKLQIPLEVVDLRESYREKVLEYFFDVYARGGTPNPDVVCNREIKFGLFYQYVKRLGFDYVATGHYARIKDFDGKKVLQRAYDKYKDQSYFLWQVESSALDNVLFPLGSMTKKEVRQKAKEIGLLVSDKPDSMGVCMMGQVSLNELLKGKLGEKRGEILFQHRGEVLPQVVGEHSGLWFYTVGERKGIEVNKKVLKKMGFNTESMPPLYVVRKDIVNNQLIVGAKEEIKTKTVRVRGLKLADRDGKFYLRIRNLGELYEVTKYDSVAHDIVEVSTKEEMEGVAEGQSAVIYKDIGTLGDEILVAGGEIVV